MADGMESWKSEDYFEHRRENPFKHIRDDEREEEERTPAGEEYKK